jgi:hypothetical protein
MTTRSHIRGTQIKDETIESQDIASGSIKAGELNAQSISGQTLITSTDTTNDRLLIWDATDSALKQVSPGNLGISGGGGGSPAGADTQVQFNDGGANFGASSNFTFDDTTLTVSTTGLNPIFNLAATNDGATASPIFTLKRNSSSPADSDYLGQIKFQGENDADQEVAYAKITGKIDDASDGTEDGILEFANIKAGSQTITARLRSDSLQLLNSANLTVDGKVGIGTTSPSELLQINAESDGDECFIQFQEAGDDRAKIGINTSNNLLFQNQYINKHIVFKVNDQGVTREGLRIDGAVPEVVVNEGSESLIDFRVESDNNTHMLFVTGSGKVGVGTPLPQATLHVHADSIHGGVVSISQADNSTDASQLDISKARGSGASPAAVQNNDFIGQIRMLGYDGDSYDSFADIYAQAAGTISTTSHPTKLVIRTTQTSATSPTTAVTIDENQHMTVNGNIYGRMMHMTHHRYNDGSGSILEYIPWAGTSEQNSPSWITQGVAPYAGKLAKVLVRSSKSGGMGSTTVGIHTNTDGNTVVNPTPEETETVTMSSQNTTYTFSFSNTTHFGPGDVIGVSIDPTNSHGNVNVTCVWEYDITA